jgi:hypothetical protein
VGPEFEKQQGNVTVAALVCRARDFDTPRIFRKHSLEYMKKSESIGFALAILEEISKGVRCCTDSARMYADVILKHYCFLDPQNGK